MKPRAAGIVGLSLLVAMAFGWWAFWRADASLTPGPTAAEGAPTGPAAGGGATEAPARVVAPLDQPSLAREPLPRPADRMPAPAASPAAQGLRGLVIDENDQPLAEVPVYLLESPSNDPLGVPLLLQQRHAMGPLSSTRTGPDGTFAISLQLVQDKAYEVHIVSPNHALARLGELRLLAGQWHDLGAITLERGATVRGRVSVEGRDDIPVPLAVVTLDAGTAFADATLRALPGLERGLSAAVDANGFYELRRAPSRGVVQISAVAPGFARVLRRNIELTTEHPVEVNFPLPPGQSLSGVVVDGNDRPVAMASIEAWPQHGAGNALLAASDNNGHFEVLGLQAFPHRLRVLAGGYENQELPDIQPGRSDLHIVLESRGSLRVRALTPEGVVLRSYQLSLRRHFEEQGGQIGLVVDVPEQRVRLDRMTDFAELNGVPMGRFRCQITTEGYAMTLSDVVEFRRGEALGAAGQVQSIDVVVTTGVNVRGRVLDENGQGLAGAIVSTQPDGATPDSPLWKMLAGALPSKVTVRKATTTADGSFELAHLALATYQLEVSHADACRTLVPGLVFDIVGERNLPPIRLLAGALVTGRATVAGRVAGQIKVVLSTAAADDQTSPDRYAVRIETVTDSEGHFQFPRRVAPGAYQLRATVVGTTEPEAQIFRQILQLQRSSTTLTVLAGQPRVECSIDLPAEH